MIETPRNQLVASCTGIGAQRATNSDSSATNSANDNATNSLKSLAGVVLKRNRQRNQCATETKKQRNFCNEKSHEKLREVAPQIEHETVTAIHESIEERAAIMEFDGGLSSIEAMQQSRSAMRVWEYRISDKPYTCLTMLCPGIDLEEAKRRLDSKFPGRLIDCRDATQNYMEETGK